MSFRKEEPVSCATLPSSGLSVNDMPNSESEISWGPLASCLVEDSPHNIMKGKGCAENQRNANDWLHKIEGQFLLENYKALFTCLPCVVFIFQYMQRKEKISFSGELKLKILFISGSL